MNAEHAERVQDCVQELQQDLIDLTRRLVDAESPSSHPESHRQIHAILSAEFQSLGFQVRPLGSNNLGRHVFARPVNRPKETPAQLLIGHYDTVWPLGTVADRPFSVDGNIIRGPGVFDMKGGLAQIVIALRALRNLELEPSLVPVVFLNADEEIGSGASTRFIKALATRSTRAFVMEPALGEEGLIKTERKGVGRFIVTAHGKAAHAGLDPEGGVSAILELSHVIQSLFALNDSDRGITVNVGTVDGGLHPNVVAPNSRAVVDVRVPTAEDADEIEHKIRGIEPVTPGIRLTINGRIGRPAMELTERNNSLWEQARSLGESLGIELKHGRAGGGSDGNTTSLYTATLDGLGPVGDGAHAEHEFVYLDRTLERTALLALLLLAAPA